MDGPVAAVDALVIPEITSANLNAPTRMIAARAAGCVPGREPLPPFHARFRLGEVQAAIT